MRHNHLLLSSILALGICGVFAGTPAQAQPDENNAPKGENPPNWNWNPGGRGGNRGVLGGRPLRLPLDAGQLRLLREQRTEIKAQNIKQRLMGAGFTDEALQTAIVNEFKAQDAAQGDLLDQWQKINQALLVNQTPAADMTVMLKDFRDAVTKEKARRATAATALENQFQISQKPVLDALLMTLGITGDEAELVGQVQGNGITQFFNLPAMGGVANGGLITPRIFTIPTPNGRGMADDGIIANGELRFTPLPQGEAAPGPVQGGNNGGVTNGMPNAAPPAGTPLPKFF